MLYYNASASTLPPSATPQLRLGVNRWETLQTLDMQRAEGINLPGSDWWCIELAFDQVWPLLLQDQKSRRGVWSTLMAMVYGRDWVVK